MKMKRWILYLVLTLMVTGCNTKQETKETEAKKQQDIKQDLIDAASKLEPSKELYFENKLEITGVGEMWDEHPTGFNDCYYWPAIEKLTNAHVSIDWHNEDDYPSTIASVLLMGKENYPDILFPDAFGVMDLADDGVIVPLDDYLDLMPNIVKAIGDRMDEVRQIDGHIYSIPTITEVPGSQTMMVRKDWLEKLGLSEPTNWVTKLLL